MSGLKVSLLAGCCAWLALSSAQAAEWRLVKDEAGIKVYLSEVEGSKYQAYRGVALIKADMASLLAQQEDVSGSCAWIHECKEQKLLKREGDTSWTYSRFNTPWPVTPRDSVLQVTTERGADGSVKRVLHGVADYVPEEKGYVRVSKVEGHWTMTPKAGGEVEVVYEVHTEPGGSVPSWLANSFVVDAPFNTLDALRKRVEKP